MNGDAIASTTTFVFEMTEWLMAIKRNKSNAELLSSIACEHLCLFQSKSIFAFQAHCI